MHFVIQYDLGSEEERNSIISTIEKCGATYSLHKVVPFSGEIIPPLNVDSKNIVCFGSYSLRHSAEKYSWSPGVFDIGQYDFRVQLEHWGNLMLNYDGQISSLNEVVIDTEAFLRPIDDTKFFAGAVFSPEELKKWQQHIINLPNHEDLNTIGETLVLVSSIKEIKAEYRYWIVAGKIVTSSRYKLEDIVKYSAEVNQHADAFVQKCIDIWQPNKAFVIDVCETADDFRIVEINTITSSGFYAGNIEKIVKSIIQLDTGE